MAKEYNRKDSYYQKAKKEGYRSRASYKLLELNEKFKFLRNGATVLDLGAWPGGWTQVAQKSVGSKGLVVAVDLVEIEEFPHDYVKTLTADLRDEETLEQLQALSPDGYNVVLSDMSAKLTGIKDADQAQALVCLEVCFKMSQALLRKSGTLIAKTFPGGDTDPFVNQMKKSFGKFNRIGLKSSRGSSKEFYLVGQQFKGAS